MPIPRMIFTPAVSVGTMIWVIRPGVPNSPVGSLARHMTIKKLASMPLEVNHLCSLMTQWSPSRTRLGFDRAGIGAGVVRFGHGETRLHLAFDQGE